MKKKYLSYLFILFIISLVIVVYLGNFSYLLYNESYYARQLEKHSVVPEAEMINTQVLSYFRDDNYNAPSIEEFNFRENIHLLDVKVLINRFLLLFEIFIIILIVSGILLLFLDNYMSFARKALLYGGGSVLGAAILFIIMALLFPLAFHLFHSLFFSSGTWVFGPSDLIIKVYPWKFFRDFFVKIILDSVLVGFVFLGVGYLLGLLKRAK